MIRGPALGSVRGGLMAPRCGTVLVRRTSTLTGERTLIETAYQLMCMSVMWKTLRSRTGCGAVGLLVTSAVAPHAVSPMALPNRTMGSQDAVQFVALHDGRRIAYREQGMCRATAKESLLVLHGLGCSRVAGMPGVSEALLKEMGVRIVSIDRPGYGLSDFNPAQTWETFCHDLVQVADTLELGEKIWLLGYSCGGAYCWAAARYIPERIAGIAMWAPAGNYYWKGISETERNKMIKAMNFRTRSTYGIVRKVPVQLQWLCYAYVRYLCVPAVGNRWVEDAKNMLSAPDVQNLQQVSGAFMARDTIESAKQGGKGMAQDAILVCSDWGYELSDVRDVYQGSIHIFNGDQDLMVPLGLQRCVKRMLPDHVHLHDVEGEGHISAFCYNDKIHRKTLECLFGATETTAKIDENQLYMRVDQEVKVGSIISATIKGPPALNAPYRIFITVCILALVKLSIVV